jgi:hypothetical protein
MEDAIIVFFGIVLLGKHPVLSMSVMMAMEIYEVT